MNSKIKKILVVILSLTLMLSALVAIGCGSKLKLVDWENEEITCELGSRLEIPEYVAKDKKGNEYPVEVTVYRKSDNARITIIENSFDVIFMDGYNINYRAYSEDKEAVKTVTVKVEDKGEPAVYCSSNKYAEVGVKYLWENVFVYDASGEIPFSIEVFDKASGEKVDSDDQGFTPTKLGEYELVISAEDKTGNQSSITYTIYARTTKKVGELESFDDVASGYTTYTKQSGAKAYAKFSAFKKSNSSLGSVELSSTAAKTTDVYFLPRNEVTDFDHFETGYISAWIYIAETGAGQRTVEFGNGSVKVKSNAWQNIKITDADVSSFSVFLNQVKSGATPFIKVENSKNSFNLYIDDVFFVEQSSDVSGIKSAYAYGEELSFDIGSKSAHLYYAGEVSKIQSGYKLNSVGEYFLSIEDASTAKEVKGYSFTVGASELSFDVKDAWFTKAQASTPAVVDGNGQSVSGLTVKYVDSLTLEKTTIGETFVPSGNFFLLASGEYKGEQITVMQHFDIKKHGKGVVVDFENENYLGLGGVDSLSFEEEFEGEYGVVKVTIGSSLSNRIHATTWQSVYNEEYYSNGNFTHLKFRVYVDKPENIGFITFYTYDYSTGAETIVGQYYPFIDGAAVDAGWNDVVIPIDLWLEYYDLYQSEVDMWYSLKGQVTLAFAQIKAINLDEEAKDKYDENVFLAMDSEKFGYTNLTEETVVTSFEEEFEGKENVVKFDFKTEIPMGGMSLPNWKAVFSKEHYINKGYTHLKFTYYISDVSKVSFLTYYATDGADAKVDVINFPAGAVNGWNEVTVLIDDVIEYFDLINSSASSFLVTSGPVVFAITEVIAVELKTYDENVFFANDSDEWAATSDAQLVGSYQSSFEGENGVIKYTVNNASGGLYLTGLATPIHSYQSYIDNGYTHLTFKFFVGSDVTGTWFFTAPDGVTSMLYSGAAVGWNEITVEISKFATGTTYFYMAGATGTFAITQVKAIKIKTYAEDVFFANDSDEWATTSDAQLVGSYQSAFEGEENVIKYTMNYINGSVYLTGLATPVHSYQSYIDNGYTHLTFKFFVGSDVTGTWFFTAPDGATSMLYSGVAAGWHEITVEISKFATGSTYFFVAGATGTFAITQVKAVKVKTYAENVFFANDSAEWAATNVAGLEGSYQSTFEGEENVIKYTLSGMNGSSYMVGLTPVHDYQSYIDKGYTHVTFKFFVGSDVTGIWYFTGYLGSGHEIAYVGQPGLVQGWNEITVAIEELYSAPYIFSAGASGTFAMTEAIAVKK